MAQNDARQKILEAALDLFRDRGFSETTMRQIAAKAGVASGLAYYYFESKNAIVLAFYHRAKDELTPLLEQAQTDRKLAARLQALVEAKFGYFAPYRRFLGALMGTAADPASPLSPFGDESKDIREADFAHFERALSETGTSVPKDLAPHMAKMLWLYQMGLILFWIYDGSKEQRRTKALLQKTIGLVVLLLKASNLPLMRPARRTVIEIIEIMEA
jgi:AcrR family transcriptional regulator